MDQYSSNFEKVAFLRGSLRVRKQERKDIRRIARTSGCEEFAVY